MRALAVASLGLPGVAQAAEGGGGSLIEVNWTLGVQLISFLLLLAVLYKFLYGPLTAALEGRTAAIQQQLAEAQAAREAAQQERVAMEERIRVAHADAQALRERALREAGELRERLSGRGASRRPRGWSRRPRRRSPRKSAARGPSFAARWAPSPPRSPSASSGRA